MTLLQLKDYVKRARSSVAGTVSWELGSDQFELRLSLEGILANPYFYIGGVWNHFHFNTKTNRL